MSNYRTAKLLTLLIIALFGAFQATGGWNELQAKLGLQGEGQTSTGTVIEATDGDTLKVRLGSGAEVSVRLIGIDTPETKRPGVAVECGGPEASDLMHKLADGKKVRLVTDPTQDSIDRYDRRLAYVYLQGSNVTLQEQMLESGLAEVYIYGNNPFTKAKDFQRIADQAEAAGKGVWSLCGGDFHSES